MATKGDISDLEHLKFGGRYFVPRINASQVKRLGIVQSDTGPGLTRSRKKFFSTPYEQSVTYRFSSAQEMDFWRIFMTRNEGKYFIGYTSADRPIVEPYVMKVISDWSESDLTRVDGKLTVTLEVVSVRDAVLDQLLFDLYQNYGDNNWLVWDLWEKILKAAPNGNN